MASTFSAPEPIPSRPESRAGDEHQAEPARHAAHAIMDRAARAGIDAVQPQPGSQRVGLRLIGAGAAGTARQECRCRQHDAENDRHDLRRQFGRQRMRPSARQTVVAISKRIPIRRLAKPSFT